MSWFQRPTRLSRHKTPANVVRFERGPSQRTQNKSKSWWKANWAIALLLTAPVVGLGVAWLSWTDPTQISSLLSPISSASEQYQVSFDRCDGPKRVTCVVDGDTFWLKGDKYRIADINTPEISNSNCSAEAELGERATSRLIGLLNDGDFSLQKIDRDEDKFGRKLRIVTRRGQSIGETLIAEGLAERWSGRRRSWC